VSRRRKNEEPNSGLVVVGVAVVAAVAVAGVIYALTREDDAAEPLPATGGSGARQDQGEDQDNEDDLDGLVEGGIDAGVGDGPIYQGFDQATDDEDLGPVATAELVWSEDNPVVESSIRRRLDEAAAAKGIPGGWSMGQGDRRSIFKRGDPGDWTQAEAWWVAANAFNDVYGDEFDEFDPAINAGIQDWASSVDTARNVVTVDGWLMGKTMARTMALTGAPSQRVGVTNPNWSLFA